MHEEVDYERRLSVMIPSCIRHLHSGDFDFSSLRPDMHFCCIDGPSNYCCFTSFSSKPLELLDLEVRLRQVHTNVSARVLLGWRSVKFFAVCSSE